MKNNLKNIFVWSYKEEYSVLRKKILKSVDKVFKSGSLILGGEVENLEKKFSNFLHHQDFEASGLKLKNIEEMVKNKKIIYDLNVDQKKYKWSGSKILNKVPLSFMPNYLSSNYEKYSNWLEI